MDSGTIAAVVALFVALITLVVASAQVAQQYLGTAGLLRKCDSTVYGPLPGRGWRAWIWRQLRFKVFYSSPNISLTAELWPEVFQSSYLGFEGLRNLRSALDYSVPAISEPEPGQASWVAFYCVMERSCYHDLQYKLVTEDADLCPSDLPVIPVEVSLRDIIVMALMNGMRVTYASLYPTKIISMLGPPGSISCAEHNILGTIVHFSSRKITGNYGVTLDGRVNKSWIHRLLADCSVAGRNLSPIERDHIEDIEGRWMRRIIQKVESTDSDWKYPRNPFTSRERRFNDQGAGSLTSRNASDYVEPSVSGTNKNMALVRVPMGAQKSAHTSTVPWRSSWPMEISKGPTQSALVPFNNAYSILQFPQDYDAQVPVIPPEAPDIPLALSDTLGINDGCWSLSSEKDPSVVLILPAPYEIPQLVASKYRWLGWLYNILGTAQNGESEEKVTFLPIVQTTVNAGWRIAKGRRIIPRFFPLPEAEDSSLSNTSKESLAAFPPSRFPPDFLDSHIELDLGRHLRSNSRSYQARAQQRHRRFERKSELLDLSLIEDGSTTCCKLFEASHHSKIDKSVPLSRSMMQRSESTAIQHKVPSHLGDQDDTWITTPQRSTPLMIKASKSTDRDVRPSESHHRITGFHRNYRAYVESVESDEEESLPKPRGTNDSLSDEDYISPNESSSRSGKFPFRHVDNPIRGATTIIPVTGNAYERNPEGIKQRVHAWRPPRPKIVSFKNGSRGGELSGSSFVSESGSMQSSYDSSGSDISEPRQSRSNPRHAGRWSKQTEAQMEAERRQRLRDFEFERRARRRRQRLQRASVPFRRFAEDLSWFWVCQMDIIPGYWATPWTGQFDPHVSLGATAVILEALLGLTDNLSLQYSSVHQVGTWSWLRDGKITFPPYARNARGGVVVEGTYESVPFEAFEQELPPIQLLHCYDYQVCKVPRVDDISVLNRQLELMAIDSWLSVVGRNPEISDGEANLLQTTPALVTTLMREFGYDFGKLVLTASEGGLQEIKEITAELMDTLGDEGLSEAEQTFVLVALLRTSKVALCISLGPSTLEIRKHLETDIQVFMV